MTRAPRTREQRTSDSRALILDAAVECLVEGGYAAATTLRVQSLAGFSRGRLLHHVPSRDELLVAAVQHLVDRLTRELLRGRAEAGGDDDVGVDRGTGVDRGADVDPDVEVDRGAAVDRGVEFVWGSFHHAYFWATTELWVAARTNPSLAAVMLPTERAHQPVVRAAMDRVFGADLAARPRYPLMRDMLVTSMRGAALEYCFSARDPRRDPRLPQWKDLARALLFDDG
nr:helix-turn-helix domain-containing protein [Micromonospora sp. DSM 115978]